MRVSLNEQSQSEWQSQNLEHLRYEYDLSPTDIVIDIGAYVGEWATNIYRRYGCRVIVIEPGPWIGHRSEFADVINKAAWIYDGKLKFGGAYYYSSPFEDTTHEYECFDINQLLFQYPEIALVKINIEGGEYKLLNHIMDAGLQKQIRNLQVQFHQIEGQDYERQYFEIAERLEETHSLTYFYPFCWESWMRK